MTDMAEITNMTDMAEMTEMTGATEMAEITEMTEMTGTTGTTAITDFTDIHTIKHDRLVYTAQERDEGREVQYILKERLHIASGMIKILKYNKGILLDGLCVKGTAPVKKGQTITALLNCMQCVPDIKPEPYPLDILYEDDAFIVINKPASTVMHPTCRHQTGTLTNFVLYHLQQKGIYSDIHLVGRLDKDTTGLVVIARNAYIQETFKTYAQNGNFEKRYIAAVSPPPVQMHGTIDAPIMRDTESIIKRKISPEGAPAVTCYNVLYTDKDRNYAVVEFILKTGRTHQIRLHTSYMGFPIIGDTLYGYGVIGDTLYGGRENKSEGIGISVREGVRVAEEVGERIGAGEGVERAERVESVEGVEKVDAGVGEPPHQLLHAYQISLVHPITKQRLVFKAAPPEEWGRYRKAFI